MSAIFKHFEGLTKKDLPTPSLLLDLDIFEANIEKMSQFSKSKGISLRPHAKVHKCPEIARRQIEAGAIGVCVATIREAEVMADAGIRGLLITSEMVGTEKVERLIRLTQRQPETLSVVDHPAHARQLSAAACAVGIDLNVLLDIDANNGRTGIPAGERAIALAEEIAKLPHLNLRGIHSYSGNSAHTVSYEERRVHSESSMAPGLGMLFKLREMGFALDIMTGGSTGTYNIDAHLQGMTELQVGSYIFMDIDYRIIGGKNGPVYDDFGTSLSVLATVISQRHQGTATVDAGLKAFSTDREFPPELKNVTGVKYRFAGDEHGILELVDPSQEIKLGDRLEFIAPHCDPTVNLYDRIYGLRGEKVEAVWPIFGRHGG